MEAFLYVPLSDECVAVVFVRALEKLAAARCDYTECRVIMRQALTHELLKQEGRLCLVSAPTRDKNT